MQSPDLIQYQRLCSGYVPGASELFPNGAAFPSLPPVSGVFQNCTVVRPAGVIHAIGVYDLLIGVPQATPLNQTALRSPNGPEPVGIGGKQVLSPPLIVALAPFEIVTDQGRFRAQARSALVQPLTTLPTARPVVFTVAYGATFLAGQPPLYPGFPGGLGPFSNTQIVRIFASNVAAEGALIDADFDFTLERVIDPGQEP